LEENGEENRAEFIRVQIELTKIPIRKLITGQSLMIKRNRVQFAFTRETSIPQIGERIDLFVEDADEYNEKPNHHGLLVEEIQIGDGVMTCSIDAKSIPIDPRYYDLSKRRDLLIKSLGLFSPIIDMNRSTAGVAIACAFVDQVTRGFVSSIITVFEEYYLNVEPLFNSYPLEMVWLSDRKPVEIGGTYNWMSGRKFIPEVESPHFIGPELYNLLDLPHAMVGDEQMDAKEARSPQDAMNALSNACVKYGSIKAKL
jgi:hypothetical protein